MSIEARLVVCADNGRTAPLVRTLCQRDPGLGYEPTMRFLLEECQRAAGHPRDR